jgi:hypothetical protein
MTVKFSDLQHGIRWGKIWALKQAHLYTGPFLSVFPLGKCTLCGCADVGADEVEWVSGYPDPKEMDFCVECRDALIKSIYNEKGNEN